MLPTDIRDDMRGVVSGGNRTGAGAKGYPAASKQRESLTGHRNPGAHLTTTTRNRDPSGRQY
jgi:hypothetical protein